MSGLWTFEFLSVPHLPDKGYTTDFETECDERLLQLRINQRHKLSNNRNAKYFYLTAA